MTGTLLLFPMRKSLKETINTSPIQNNNVVNLFPTIDAFAVLVNEFREAGVEVVAEKEDNQNIILPDDYVIQCVNNRYHVIKIEITSDEVIPKMLISTDDAEHLAGVIEWYQTFDMMDEQFQV